MSTINKKKLYSVDDCQNLNIDQVHELYRKYINSSQVDLISLFGFGRDLVEKSEGAYIYTKNNKKILDFTGGIGVLNHGHNNQKILDIRIKFQNEHRMEVHKNYFSPYLAALSHNLANIMPGDLNISYFPNSGSEAVEGAVKMAYKYHNGSRKNILHADISFHGKLLGAAGLTGSPELSFEFPKIPNIDQFEYNNFESVKNKVDIYRHSSGESDVYAIIIEPLNASSLQSCDEIFLRSLRKLCDDENIILIFDEVYTGWAKTGELFYFMHFDDLIPDIVTMAKSLGGGKASIAGYITREDIFRQAYDNLNDATLHSTTYNGFGEETVTAIEAINIIIEEDYVSKSKNIYNILNTGLKNLQKKYPKLISEVRGSGALNGIILNSRLNSITSVMKLIPSKLFKDENIFKKIITAAVISDLYSSYNILTFFGSNREIPLIIAPPIITEMKDIEYFLSSLDDCLNKGILILVTNFIKSKYFN